MMLKRRDLIIGTGAAALASAAPAIGATPTRIIGGPAFGSAWRLVLAGSADAETARSVIETVIAGVDATMSPYKHASALSRFNRGPHAVRQAMPASLCAVAREALAIARQTGGAFDPTVGPLVNRFGFGPIKGKAGGFGLIAVDEAAMTKAEPHLTLDLCGIAKGHALDEAVSRLRDIGVDRALVELGGEVMALGRHPDDRDWQVAIEDPLADEFAAHRIVAPQGKALATSGHRVNGLMGRTSHIIDPGAGRPVTGALASVSVLADTAMRADAMATALCAMGAGRGIAFARERKIDALFVLSDGSGKRNVMTGAFVGHVIA